jgi:hypothetical protein
MNPVLRHHLPGLRSFRIASDASDLYNCVAWALGDTSRWWQASEGPDSRVKYFWPDDVPDDDTVQAWTLLFRAHGFEPCEDGAYEEGFLKVAIYGDDDGATHVARLDGPGVWVSKLGRDVDIVHETYEELEGDYYGKVQAFMKKPLM